MKAGLAKNGQVSLLTRNVTYNQRSDFIFRLSMTAFLS